MESAPAISPMFCGLASAAWIRFCKSSFMFNDLINFLVRAYVLKDGAILRDELKYDSSIIFDMETPIPPQLQYPRKSPESLCVRKRASIGLSRKISTHLQNCLPSPVGL